MAKIKPLRENPFFSDFTDKEIALFSRIVEEQNFPAGADIFSEETGSVGMYIVKSGKVEIAKTVGEEDIAPLGAIGRGEVFGQLSLVDEGEHIVTARSVEKVSVLYIEREKFDDFLEKHPEAAAKLLRALAKSLSAQLRQAGELFAAYIAYKAENPSSAPDSDES